MGRGRNTGAFVALAATAFGSTCHLAESGLVGIDDSGRDTSIPPADGNTPEVGAPDTATDGVVDAAPPPFDPSSLTGLALWLRADEGVTSDGGLVTSWTDQSGLGHDVMASDTAGQPSLVVSDPTYDDRPTLSFQTANTSLQASSTWHLVQPYTVLFVSNASGQILFDSNDATHRASILTLLPMSNVQLYTNSHGRQPTDGGPSIASPSVIVAVFAGVNSALYVDGTEAWSGDLGTDDCWGVTANGNYSSGGFALAGSIAEVAIWTQALDASSIMQVDAYTHKRYGLP